MLQSSMDWNSPTTQLLTLLNVSAAKSLKLKRANQQSDPPQKLNKNRRVLDRTSSGAELETTDNRLLDARKDDSNGDAGIDGTASEAANLSDTEGM